MKSLEFKVQHSYELPGLQARGHKMKFFLPMLLVGVDRRSYFLSILSSNRNASVLLLLKIKKKKHIYVHIGTNT